MNKAASEIKFKEIYCCGCKKEGQAFLTDGKKVYPHRPDLAELPFWMCFTCDNYVGCHHKTKNPTKPLGNIPNAEMRNARQHIHKLIDPLWQNYPEKFRARAWIYRWIGQQMGADYHTAEIKTIDEAKKVYRLVRTIKNVEDCQ